MRKIVRTLAMLSVAGTMVVPMSPARAAAERYEFECDAYAVSFVDTSETRAWEAGPTFHARTAVETNRTVGSEYCAGFEIVGPEVGANEAVIVLGPGGTYWGTFRYELEGELSGSGFEGRWQMQCLLPTWCEGEEVGTGYGHFEGWQFRDTFQLNPDQKNKRDIYYWVWGYVFNPGG